MFLLKSMLLQKFYAKLLHSLCSITSYNHGLSINTGKVWRFESCWRRFFLGFTRLMPAWYLDKTSDHYPSILYLRKSLTEECNPSGWNYSCSSGHHCKLRNLTMRLCCLLLLGNAEPRPQQRVLYYYYYNINSTVLQLRQWTQKMSSEVICLKYVLNCKPETNILSRNLCCMFP